MNSDQNIDKFNKEAKSLVDEGFCVSMGEARRLISNTTPETLQKLKDKIRQKKDQK